MDSADQKTWLSRLAVVLFCVFALVLAISGYIFITAEHRTVTDKLHARLLEAARMKARQVADWRRERESDAEVLAADIKLMDGVQKLLKGNSSVAEFRRIAVWLDSIRAQYKYSNLILLDSSGKVQLALLPPALTGNQLHHLFRQAITSEHVQLGELAIEGITPAPFMTEIIRLTSDSGALLGALALTMNPADFLYPALNEWTGAGQTGELLLFRPDGDFVVYMNDLRLRPGSAVLTRLPLQSENLPAARALRGLSIVDGIDYRGKEVVAAAARIPNSDWFIEAKIDHSEAFEPLRRDNWLIIALLACLLLSGATLGRAVLRRHAAQIYREKYEAELERKRLLGRYDFLTRYASDAVLLLEEDGTLLEVNDRACEMFGYSRDEFLRMSVLDLKPDHKRNTFQDIVARLKQTDHGLFETVNKRKDGTIFPTELSSTLITIEDRTYIQSIIRDITERKEAEHQISRLNRLYAVLSHCNASIVKGGSADKLFQEVCDIAVAEGGFRIAWIGKHDPATGRVWPVAKSGECAGYLEDVRIMAEAGPLGEGPSGRCLREKRTIICPDFETDPHMAPWRETAARYGLRSSISLPLFHSGSVRYQFGLYSNEPAFFSEDETKLAEEVGASLSLGLDRIDSEKIRLQAELELRASQERLELALDATREGYWDYKLQTGECFVSPRYDRILGFEPGELPTPIHYPLELIHPDDLEAYKAAQRALLEHGLDVVGQEFRALHKKGHYVWIEGKALVVERNASGHPLRIIGTRNDITQRKVLEQEFLQAQKMESIGRLAGGVAHDFNNHLTVISGYAELLLHRVQQENPMHRALSAIYDAAGRASSLTRQLLAFSRKSVDIREAINLNKAVASIEKMLNRLIGENIKLELHLAQYECWVMADATNLDQVLMNLVVNSRDAITGRGRITIETGLTVRRGEHPRPDLTGKFICLSVTDTGSGMPPEMQQRIFEPFFTTKDKSHGTGLGLATVYAIVHAHGGLIELESELDKGTTFHIYLPAIDGPATMMKQSSASKLQLYGKGTILVAEDQDEVREFASTLLKRYGYDVLTAAGGQEALDIANSHQGRIDLLLTDVMMPGMNGPELVMKIKPLMPDLKVIYASGYPGNEINQDVLVSEGAIFLAKPYSAEALTTSIGKLLAAANGADATSITEEGCGPANAVRN